MPESSEKSLLTQEIRATIGYESEPIVASSCELRRDPPLLLMPSTT